MHRDVWEAVPYGYRGNVYFTVVGTRRAVSAVIIKLYRLIHHYRYKQTFP